MSRQWALDIPFLFAASAIGEELAIGVWHRRAMDSIVTQHVGVGAVHSVCLARVVRSARIAVSPKNTVPGQSALRQEHKIGHWVTDRRTDPYL
ncbi:MAG: hypothetical protein ACK4VP_02540 [Nitrospira sp.]